MVKLIGIVKKMNRNIKTLTNKECPNSTLKYEGIADAEYHYFKSESKNSSDPCVITNTYDISNLLIDSDSVDKYSDCYPLFDVYTNKDNKYMTIYVKTDCMKSTISFVLTNVNGYSTYYSGSII